jgi:hypothetical protein
MELPIKLKSQIRWWLQSPNNYMGSFHEDSIMKYDCVCKHDDGFMCEHRIEKLINLIEDFEYPANK